MQCPCAEEAGMSDPIKAAVVLLGSHSLGSIRSTMPHDAASGTGFAGAGPVCIGGPGPMTAHPNIFDNHYYREACHSQKCLLI